VFAYLKPTPAAEDVLRALKRAGCSTLAYVDGITPAARKRLESPTLHLTERRVDIARVSRECDLAVLNGGHGVTAEMLLAGKPVLAVPLVLEQQMTGDALKRLGAGESAPPRRGEPWEWSGAAKLEAMLTDGRYAAAARRFADRYAAFDPQRQRAAMLERAEELLASVPGATEEGVSRHPQRSDLTPLLPFKRGGLGGLRGGRERPFGCGQ
jgi:UDP:flavonoid glycosyltransferase YjiC (YdhE family)